MLGCFCAKMRPHFELVILLPQTKVHLLIEILFFSSNSSICASDKVSFSMILSLLLLNSSSEYGQTLGNAMHGVV